MGHKFNPENKKRLSDEFRKKILPARQTLKDAGLKTGMTIADVGCGNGYFTFNASEIVGNKGRVFALDISSEMLEDIIAIVKKKDITNIEAIKTEENNLKIGIESVDLAFSCNVVHEAKDPVLFLIEIKRILKNHGRIAVIDWERIDSDFGPPKGHRIDKIVLMGQLKDMGFKYIKTKSLNKDLYRITALKNSGRNHRKNSV